MRILTAIFAVSALVSTGAASAQTQDAAKPPKEEKKICRSEVQLGSNLGKRTCRTRAEWAQLARAQREQMERSRPMDSARGSTGAFSTGSAD